MRTPLIALLALASLAGCRNDYNIQQGERETAALELELSSPSYGAFLGDEPVRVEGTVSPRYAVLEIEGQVVEPDADGHFSVDLPVGGPYNIIDVQARIDKQHARERVPVFSGHDPMETWPGGLTGRLMPAGMSKLGEVLGMAVDDLGWASQLTAILPGYSGSVVSLTPIGVSNDPTVVHLLPAEGGMDALFTLNNVTIDYEIGVPAFGLTETLSIGYETVAIGGSLIPTLDEDGVIWLQLTDPQIDFEEPIFEIGFLEGWLVDIVMNAVNEWVIEPLGELVLSFVLDEFGVFELGGPFSFDLDLLGTPMQVRLSDIFAELSGLGLELGVGLGEPASLEPLGIPTPDLDTPYAADSHIAIGLHEGLFQLLMEDALLPYLSQDLALSGSYGELIGAGIRNLPGGEQAPEGEGWCLSLDPGTAYVARLQEMEAADGPSPLAMVYLPDFIADIGIQQNGTCQTWLKASLAMELGLGVDGTALDLSLGVAEGVVLEYGADEVEEAEVVEALGTYLETTLGLLAGSMLDLDLGDLLGGLDSSGLMGDLSPELVGSARLVPAQGAEVEGLYSISLTLWE